MTHEIKFVVPDEIYVEMQVKGLNFQTDPPGFARIALEMQLELMRRIANGNTILNIPASGDVSEMTEIKLGVGLFESSVDDIVENKEQDFSILKIKNKILLMPILLATLAPLLVFLLRHF